MYNQRDIVLIPFPYSDLTGFKQRPALIISNNEINKTEDRICCLVTTNKSKESIIIERKDFESGKLPFKSWIKAHRLFTIHEKIIRKGLCTINARLYNKLLKKINECLKII